jgi:hypothetical protein
MPLSLPCILNLNARLVLSLFILLNYSSCILLLHITPLFLVFSPYKFDACLAPKFIYFYMFCKPRGTRMSGLDQPPSGFHVSLPPPKPPCVCVCPFGCGQLHFDHYVCSYSIILQLARYAMGDDKRWRTKFRATARCMHG